MANPLLQVELSLFASNLALITERKLTYTWILFSSSVLGLIFGSMSAFGMLMMYSESLSEVILSKRQKIKKIENLKTERRDLKVNFDELYQIENIEKEVFNFTFEDHDNALQTNNFD